MVCGLDLRALIFTSVPFPILYTRLSGPQKAVYDEALDMLTCTAWDGDLQAAKSARSALAKLLGVNNVPAPKKAAGSGGDGETNATTQGGGGTPRKADELESYESLVRTMGY